VCKGLAYGASLSAFRGGPVFPAMYIGAAAGMALSHLPGLGLVAGVAMGIGALSAVMLRLPFTAVLLATLLMGADGIGTMPVVIVAVVVAFVVAAAIDRPPSTPVPPGASAAGEAAMAPGSDPTTTSALT
jgi:H+/Cl- antiporter ClcA